MRVRWVAIAIVGMAVLVGCTSVDVREIQPDRAPDLSIISAFQGGDIEPAMSPEEMVELPEDRKPVAIVVGAVEGIVPGRDVKEAGDWAHFLVLRCA